MKEAILRTYASTGAIGTVIVVILCLTDKAEYSGSLRTATTLTASSTALAIAWLSCLTQEEREIKSRWDTIDWAGKSFLLYAMLATATLVPGKGFTEMQGTDQISIGILLLAAFITIVCNAPKRGDEEEGGPDQDESRDQEHPP